MSAASVELTQGLARSETTTLRSRMTLVFVVIVVTSLSAFLLALVTYVWPISHGDQPTYGELAAHRTYAFVFFAVAGIQLVLGVCAAAIAGVVLAGQRGARLATIGAFLLFLGAAAYGVGIGGWASSYWFVTDTNLPVPAANALVQRMNSDTTHTLLVPIGGAIIVAIGSLVLVAAIWRARAMPAWILAVTAVSTVVTVVLPPASIAGVIGEAVSSATTIAIGWYALKLVTSRVEVHLS
jgi:hypothetical protein